MVAAQWGDHCGRGRRGDYISDSAGLPGRRLQPPLREGARWAAFRELTQTDRGQKVVWLGWVVFLIFLARCTDWYCLCAANGFRFFFSFPCSGWKKEVISKDQKASLITIFPRLPLTAHTWDGKSRLMFCWDSRHAVFMEEVNIVSFNILWLRSCAVQSSSLPRWAARFWSES